MFQKFEAWQAPGLLPIPTEALKLLHRLAADPGIAGIMTKHCWSVGLLSEMPPEGKVGVSPVCILGVNINAGQEISLRLRTDDLKGFRRHALLLLPLLSMLLIFFMPISPSHPDAAPGNLAFLGREQQQQQLSLAAFLFLFLESACAVHMQCNPKLADNLNLCCLHLGFASQVVRALQGL